MTTRNFRVNNGLEVGDIVISASANTITGGTTSAPSADGQFANKKYVDDQAAETLTLTNKTLTAPKFADTGFLADANGNQLLVFGQTSSAVNEFKITNKDTGNSPILAATGDDTNIGMAFTAKGTGDIDLNAGADVNIPVNIGLTFAGTEKIESDGTDLTITVGSAGDINIGADIGLTFGNDGEKIEGDGTDLTINSSALLNLTAGTAIVVPSGIPLRFVDDNEKITSNGTALTINSGEDINLTCATGDVNLPANIGLTFGDDGEKIEGNGTNLTIASSGTCTITATGETIVTNDMRVAGNLTVDGTETIINTTSISVEDNVIEVNRNVSANSGMPSFSGLKVNRGDASTATEQDLFWVWDETFADDGTTIHGNAGGAFTALRSQSTGNSPQTDFSLVDVRANVVHATSTSAQYADVAERFEADAPMAEGAVVEVGGEAEITETTSEMSENVFGVISTQPAYAMNAGAGNNDSHPFVAMTGRTPVRVAGAVTKGQRLVTSSIKGCARAVAIGESISPFNVIGRALENSSDTGIKLVNCAVRTNN
tara:strand:+ start:1114 stop:2745 length:1632 start_codon:yes stop_codon:yes gene_type:complete